MIKVLDGELLRQLSGNLELLVNVIYALAKPEADAKGIMGPANWCIPPNACN